MTYLQRLVTFTKSNSTQDQTRHMQLICSAIPPSGCSRASQGTSLSDCRAGALEEQAGGVVGIEAAGYEEQQDGPWGRHAPPTVLFHCPHKAESILLRGAMLPPAG